MKAIVNDCDGIWIIGNNQILSAILDDRKAA